MKTSFNSLDVAAIVSELKDLVGMRIHQIYDVDNKTYLFKISKKDVKGYFIMESGSRIHTTKFDWNKNNFPSGFTMKLRKHLCNKRVTKLSQIGNDRIIILGFGEGVASYHLIVEFFQRGNIVLTDSNMKILSVLTPHTEKNNVKFAVHETYPMSRAHTQLSPPSLAELQEYRANASKDDTILKTLLPKIDFGAPLIEHALLCAGLTKNQKLATASDDQLVSLEASLLDAKKVFTDVASGNLQGVIVQKIVKNSEGEDVETYLEFHPYLFKQHESLPHISNSSFGSIVDDYFCKIQSQSIELKAIQMEKEVLNKVNKIKLNQDSRIHELNLAQEKDVKKAEVISCNATVIDQATTIINQALASQMDWNSIKLMVQHAKDAQDPIALLIKSLNFETNSITLSLRNLYDESEEQEVIDVDVDLHLSAHSNAKKYYNHKKFAAEKERKTIEAQDKALVSAQKKARTALKEIKTSTTIKKLQKPFWFEKFYWFISSENYLVIGGRDQAQNELVVKRYMNAGDIYVHADIHGASNVIIKNPSAQPVPIKTLNEAGTMAVCCSVGWEAKVLCAAWWVNYDQVSKTAPTGEYLSTGSFMVRGHKNFLLPAQLAMGCAFMFRVSDECVENHKDERKAKCTEIEPCGSGSSANKPSAETDLKTENPSSSQTQEEENFDSLSISSKSTGLDDDDNMIGNEIADDIESKDGDDEEKVIEDDEDDADEVESKDSDKEESEKEDDVEETPVENKEAKGNKNSDNLSESNDNEHEEFGRKMNRSQKRKQANKKPSGTKISKDQSANEYGKAFVLQHGKDFVPLKRGQRSKLKKIKEKYRDQDDEEKKLRLQVLGSAGEKKLTKKELRNLKHQKTRPVQRPKNPQRKAQEEDEGDDVNDPDIKVLTDLDALAILTGQPLPDDEILYAVPVIAPYNSLQNYKFKLKLVPGTTKRGKAAKLAIETFLRHEECTQREKDLIKTIEFQKFGMNFPGRVKISVPVAVKKKKPAPKASSKST